MKKKIGTILLSVIIAAGISMASFGAVNGQVNGQWQQDASTGAWYYRNVDDGTALTDFQCINGKWYFLSTAEDGTKGMMLTGLQWIGHKLYYLNPDDGGAVAFNMDYGGYHFGQYGAAVNNIGNPLLMGETGYRTRLKSSENLEMPEIPVDTVAQPAAEDNADVLAIYRQNFYGSAVEEMATYYGKYGYMPYASPLTDEVRLELAWIVRSKTAVNVFYKLAGLDLPFDIGWNEEAQGLYDWFIDFYQSYDWENASDYDKAYHIYTWLGSRYDYGGETPQMIIPSDPGAYSYLAQLVKGSSMVCVDFAQLYYILADSVGLDVGFSWYTSVQSHEFNLVNIDGTIYCADASGYAKYGKAGDYFGEFEDMFFYDISDPDGIWDNGPVGLKPVAESYLEEPLVTYY